LDEASQVSALTSCVPAAGAAAVCVPAGVTRNIATPWAGGVADSSPVVVLVAFVHRFSTSYDDQPPMPSSAALVAIVAAASPRLNRTTATDPSAIGFAQTSWLPVRRSRRPCEPPQSWLTATTSEFLMIDNVSALIARRSFPNNSGELSSAHRLKCEVYSVVVMPPLPTSSMSGSL
jgi:hypothetical protein